MRQNALARLRRHHEHWVVAALYLGLLYCAGVLSLVPSALWGLSLIWSVVSFAMYAVDKRAAMEERTRIPERKLLVLDFVGGWPGGLVAQRLFAHKTEMVSYRIKFRFAVYGNVFVTVLLFLGNSYLHT